MNRYLAVFGLGFLCSLFPTPTCVAATPPETKVVIWKFDDVRAGEKARLSAGFKRLGDWSQKENTSITMGVICNSLSSPNEEDVAWIKKHAVENGGLIEFWLHGWDHQAFTSADGQKLSEFKGTPLATQATHLKQACELFAKTTGLKFHTFGSPFNQFDEQTPLALDQVPDLTIWLYGPNRDSHRRILARSLNLEIATGKVSAETFLKSYQQKKPTSPLVLQGHCGQWDETSYQDFLQISEFLKKEGWQAQTAAQFCAGTKPSTPVSK